MIKRKRDAPTTSKANEELTSDREETLQSEEVDLTKNQTLEKRVQRKNEESIIPCL